MTYMWKWYGQTSFEILVVIGVLVYDLNDITLSLCGKLICDLNYFTLNRGINWFEMKILVYFECFALSMHVRISLVVWILHLRQIDTICS